MILTNWLLPYACKATLFDRTKPDGVLGLPSSQMWYSSWPTQQAEQFMALHDAPAGGEQGEDFKTLLDLWDSYDDWTAGREKVLFGRPLRPKMVLELRGRSQQAEEEYVASLMS